MLAAVQAVALHLRPSRYLLSRRLQLAIKACEEPAGALPDHFNSSCNVLRADDVWVSLILFADGESSHTLQPGVIDYMVRQDNVDLLPRSETPMRSADATKLRI